MGTGPLYPGERIKLATYDEGWVVHRHLIEGDSLSIRTEQIVSWEIFYGASSPENVATHAGTAYEKARYTVEGDRLTLDYLSYPADAPVATTATFVRLR